MAKIKIEYDSVEESDVAVLAINVVSLWSRVDDVRDMLRDHLKYGKELTMEEVYTELCRIIDDYPLS